jgi:hypothetical protein
MRAKLIHHSREWLDGDFEAPDPLAKKASLLVWHLHRQAQSARTAMKLNRGAGVWDGSGRLLFYLEQAADLGWSVDGRNIYSLENVFGPCQEAPGVRHLLRRRDAVDFHVISEMEICVPMGGMEYLVLDRLTKRGLVTWLDQTQWGYAVIDLRTMVRLPMEYRHPSASLAPPGFATDAAFVVSCSRFRSGWWTDVIDDYWNSPSMGGAHKVGTIAVQDLDANRISQHDLIVDLPSGWIPDKPSAGEWNMIWGPEFVSAREFRVWLPDDSPEILQLPLPDRIAIGRPLGSRRHWME